MGLGPGKRGVSMKVFLAYPNKLVADGLACLVNSSTDLEVAGSCRDRESSYEQIRTIQPDVIVISSALFEGDRETAIKQIREAAPAAGLLVVSAWPSRDEFLWVMEGGVAGYMTIDCSGRDFVEALRKVGIGEVVVKGIDSRAPAANSVDKDQQSSKLMNLTPREKEILSLLSQGFSNKQIAENLYVSEHTVRTHVQNLRGKLNVRSKFQAAMVLMQAGGRTASSMRF